MSGMIGHLREHRRIDQPKAKGTVWHWPTIGLGTKVGASIIIGTVTMIGLFSYLGTAALAENTDRTLQERVVLAQMTASYVDALIENTENVLTHLADEEDWFNPAGIDDSLEQADRRLGSLASQIFVTDGSGRILGTHPLVPDVTNLAEISPVMAVLNGSPFAVSHIAQPLGSLGPNLIAAAPVHNKEGRVAGALAITLNLTGPNIRAFSNPIGLGQSGYMDLVALDGRILTSTRPSRVGSESDHGSSLRGMIRDHRQSVSPCHDCHTPPTESEPRAEVMAFAPLDRAQWGITVRQSENEVFASTRLLQSRVFELMMVMLGGALVLVYLATRSVIVPVQALTAATRRIASGDLDSPIHAHGKDEVGILAQSFDEMRIRLKQYTEEIQAWNRELDARVQERTAAVEKAAEDNTHLYAELQRKEQLRGELLSRVISVQEDERKRIARELHDETSQGLSALMVGLDTVRLALSQDVEKAKGHLRSCNSIAESLLKNIHRLISDLRPTLLDDLGLEPAIAWYGEQRLKPLGITLKMTGNSLRERLPPAIETPLFRIVQEAITNVIRHANATVVKVSLLRQANEVTLQISDNGRGFDHAILHSADPHGKGLGLRGMQERAGILGGEFQLETSATGTTITIRVPLSN